MTYAAPLRDIRFVLYEMIGVDDKELIDAILDEAARFAGEVLAPLNQTGDAEGARWHDGAVSTPQGSAMPTRSSSPAAGTRWLAIRRMAARDCPPRRGGGGGDVARRQHGVRAVPAADARRDRGAVAVRHRGAEGALPAEDGRGHLDRHDEPHRAAGRLRSCGRAHRAAARKATTTASLARRSSSPTASTILPRTSSISCWRERRTRRRA